MGERCDVLIADLRRVRPSEAVYGVASTLLTFLGCESRSGRMPVPGVRIGVIELCKERGEDGGVTPKFAQHCCLASAWQQ